MVTVFTHNFTPNSRIADDGGNYLDSCDVDVTSTAGNSYWIVLFFMCNKPHGGCNAVTLRTQWQRDSGAWNDLGSTGDVHYTSGLTTPGAAGCQTPASGHTYVLQGSSSQAMTGKLNASNYAEWRQAIEFNSNAPSGTYRFRLYDVDKSSPLPSNGYAEFIIPAGGQDYTRNVSESMGITEYYLEENLIDRVYSESLSKTDLITNYVTYSREYTESYSVTDFIDTSLLITKSLIESNSISSSITRIVDKSIVDTLSIVDNIIRQLVYQREYTETLTITSTVTTTLVTMEGLFKTLTEPMSIVDSYSRIIASIKEYTETMTLSDVITKHLTKQLTDGLSLVDTKLFYINKVLTNPLDIVDKIGVFIPRLVFSETMSIIDTVSFPSLGEMEKGIEIRLLKRVIIDGQYYG